MLTLAEFALLTNILQQGILVQRRGARFFNSLILGAIGLLLCQSLILSLLYKIGYSYKLLAGPLRTIGYLGLSIFPAHLIELIVFKISLAFRIYQRRVDGLFSRNLARRLRRRYALPTWDGVLTHLILWRHY